MISLIRLVWLAFWEFKFLIYKLYIYILFIIFIYTLYIYIYTIHLSHKSFHFNFGNWSFLSDELVLHFMYLFARKRRFRVTAESRFRTSQGVSGALFRNQCWGSTLCFYLHGLQRRNQTKLVKVM